MVNISVNHFEMAAEVTITLSTEDGNFSVSMMLYKDEAFQDMWTTVPSLKLDDNIFVRVHMPLSFSPFQAKQDLAEIRQSAICIFEERAVQSESSLEGDRWMWRSQPQQEEEQPQPGDNKRSCSYVFLHETLSIIMNGMGAEAMFRIQMFKFVGLAYNNVFLHCSVQICHNTEFLCKLNCTNNRRVARNRRELPTTHTVTYGPISLKVSDDRVSDSAQRKFIPVETMILVCVLTVVLVITGVFGKLMLNSRRSYPDMQAQLTLANIHRSELA
ncbi:ZP domain-containing protein-like [Pseudophryne corroboree]|uniref:ZP domain-containing protein-like n=1 Tax=Pseudophryne corroboree TaxID=495146 RepID=UPI003081AE4C